MQNVINIINKITPDFVISPNDKGGSFIVLSFNYSPFKLLNPKEYAQIDAYYLISNYSYHKAKELANELKELGLEANYVFNINYKKLANELNFSKYGKNVLTYKHQNGSYFVMQVVEIDKQIECKTPLKPSQIDCRNCTKCIDYCPTNALSEYKLDTKKCLRFLQENSKFLDKNSKEKMQNKLLGCNICQAVCPYNNINLVAYNEDLKQLLKYENLFKILKDKKQIKEKFTPFLGANYARQKVLLNNAIVCAGNSKNTNLIPHLKQFLSDEYEQIIVENANEAINKLNMTK